MRILLGPDLIDEFEGRLIARRHHHRRFAKRCRALPPTHQQRTEGESTAESGHQQQAAGLHASFLERIDQAHRYRGGAHVAVLLYGDHHAIHLHTGVLGHRFDDAQVGLMGHHEIDVVGGEIRLAQHTG